MSLLQEVERLRLAATAALDESQRGVRGQFLTPANVARILAGLIGPANRSNVRILEPGAGAGSLIAAAVDELIGRSNPPSEISVTAYELDDTLISPLEAALSRCKEECATHGIVFSFDIMHADFIEASSPFFEPDLFGNVAPPEYDVVISNPPYRKLKSDSEHRRTLRRAGVETTNLYSAFVGLAVQMLAPGGEVIAITPRSFCNGPYFRPFRNLLLRTVALQDVHIFESRSNAFSSDAVLQEHLIWRGVQGAAAEEVRVVSSFGPDTPTHSRIVNYDHVVWPCDPEKFIHIVPDEGAQRVTDDMRNLPCALHELDVEVSTGRVVDFRVKDQLRTDPEPGCAPLVYPAHFKTGFVHWPISSRKANALLVDERTAELLVPNETYVLLKRFSSKEERRRVVAAVYDPARLNDAGDAVGFENHLNYLHRNGRGLPRALARGLSTFLNSTLVDEFFRQFSGHTQVNAADLRILRFPTATQLTYLGETTGDQLPKQQAIDRMVSELCQTRGAAV